MDHLLIDLLRAETNTISMAYPMADSGVDTSNESSDNPVIEFNPQPGVNEEPLQFCMPIEFFGEPEDHVGKMKCTTRYKEHRYCRIARRQYGASTTGSKAIRLRFASSTNNSELVEHLLRTGADPNSFDNFKRSPLHIAACRGYGEVVRLLLRYGANPNNKDSLGNTPLHLAACTNHVPVVIQLLDAGTDVSSNDMNGRTPIQLAQSKLKLIQMRPSSAGNFKETQQLISEICMVVEMMVKYMKVQKADAKDLESLSQRLQQVNTREEVDSEVQNLLNSLNSLNL